MMTTEIMRQPYSKDQLLALCKTHNGRVKGVIALRARPARREQATFEEEVCRRVTGSRYGLIDLTIRVAGSFGDDILFEVGGTCRSCRKLRDRDGRGGDAEQANESTASMSAKSLPWRSGRMPNRTALAGQLVAELHDFADANLFGFLDDDEHLADGTAYGDLGIERAVDVMNRSKASWTHGSRVARPAGKGLSWFLMYRCHRATTWTPFGVGLLRSCDRSA